MQTEAAKGCIRTGNQLLRGELSAVQAYEMAIRRHPGLAAAFNLEQISNEHRRSVRLLKAVVREMGGEPGTDSAFRGLFAISVHAAARFPGAKSMVESLRLCEEHRRNAYEDALDAGTTMEGLKSLICTDLLTSVENHLTRLERISQPPVQSCPGKGR